MDEAKSPEWNVQKFERTLERQLKHRHAIVRSISLDTPPPSTSLFDQFLIIGVDPADAKDTPPKILMAYPAKALPVIDYKRLIALALPTGAFRSNLRGNSIHPLQDEFIFTIANDQDPIYGVCLHVSAKSSKAPFFASNQTKQCIYAFVMMTQMPVVAAHLSFLSYIALYTHNQISNPYTFPIAMPAQPMGKHIPNLIIENNYGHVQSIHIPEYFISALQFYESLDIKHESIKLTELIELFFPATPNYENILWAGMDTLFSLLSTDDILRVVASLMQDAQVLVIGSNLQELSMSVLSLELLIKPFHFCGTIIPVLPNTVEFFNLLQSPAPFIIGVPPVKELREMSFLETTIFINLDKAAVSASPLFADYPDHAHVTESINKALKKSTTKTRHPFSFPIVFKQYLKHKYSFTPTTCTYLISIMKKPFEKLFSDYIFCFFVSELSANSEGLTVFNSELFLSQMDNNCRPFFQALTESQTFQLYIEKRICQFLSLKDKSSPIAPITAPTSTPEEEKIIRVRARTRSLAPTMLPIIRDL